MDNNRPIKGRGSHSRLPGRFERTISEAVDDGWCADTTEEFAEPALRTQVHEETARSILSRNTSPDVGFNVSLNPYRGCEHGCSYCFARPSHAWLNLSPGLDFETRIFAKTNAAQRLLHTLSRPGYVPEPIALGINTDAYQPIERSRQLTRQCLQVLHDCGHPVSLITKNALIEAVLEAAWQAGARRAGYVLLRLPHEVAPLFRDWLAAHYPQRAAHVMSTVQQLRGGKDYDSSFGQRMRGTGVYAQLLARRFGLACRRLGYAASAGQWQALDGSHFVPPQAPRPPSAQGELF